MALYDDAKARVDRVQERYEALVDEVEGYRDWVAAQLEAERAKPEPDGKFLSAMGTQAGFSGKLLDVLEEQAFFELLHFADRVIRIKHWEDGVFI